MKRDISKALLRWKDHPLRMPLIMRGARQVGKTYVIEQFGKEEFSSLVTLNFEAAPRFCQCFETMDPKKIIREIELLSQKKIIPGETLLFFDEIQQCPQALQSLRYFKEEMPQLHVIAAGSLLEFSMQQENFSFPVGRVQFMRLYPLSFEEYLDAIGDTALRKELYHIDLQQPPSLAIHEYLLDKIRTYFLIGGMPAAIVAFLKTHSLLEVQYIQKAILDTYENDFPKYAPHTQHRHLKKIFQQASHLIGEHVKYSRIDPELPNPAREMKRAIELLKLAGLVHPISATSAHAIPLASGVKETIFKLLFLDIGLIQQAMNIDPHHPGLMTGALAEQFVGQELLAYGDPLLETNLFFWTRKEGSAEVDYLLAQAGEVIPIEVKAGKTGKLKSLLLFLHENKNAMGIKISAEPLQKNGSILSIPFYLIAHLSRFCNSLVQNIQ